MLPEPVELVFEPPEAVVFEPEAVAVEAGWALDCGVEATAGPEGAEPVVGCEVDPRGAGVKPMLEAMIGTVEG